jgi:carboxyl-terminal processing protease
VRSLIWIPLVLVLLVCGIYLGGHPDGLPGFVRDPLVVDQDTRVVREAIDDVHDRYYRPIPRSKLADKAIDGIVTSLGDRFSSYFSPGDYKRFQEVQNAEFSGVGITVSEDKRGLRVADVFDRSPADRAGIRPGDVIVAANGVSLRGKTQNQSVALIKGRPGTAVTLRVRHKGRVRTKRLVRATVSVPVVASHMRAYKGTSLATIRLAQFSSGAHAEVYDAVRRVLRRGAKGIVLDLRGNGGGLVDEAQLIASAFIPEGPIVTTRGRAVAARTLNATGNPVAPKTPLVVLVDRGTASASEIVAGALQDRKRASLVGTRTFGKGVFQQIIELSNGGALDITAGQYFTPSGRNLGGKGVRTGVGLKPSVPARDDPDTRRDEALDVALRVLAGKTA